MQRATACAGFVFVWAVILAAAPADAQHDPITGDLPSGGGFGLIVWGGGGAHAFEAAAESRGCELTSLWATQDGAFVAYVLRRPGLRQCRLLRGRRHSSRVQRGPITGLIPSETGNAPLTVGDGGFGAAAGHWPLARSGWLFGAAWPAALFDSTAPSSNKPVD